MLERWELMANSIIDIKDILNEYSEDIQEEITRSAERIAKDGANELKNTTNTYHVRTGKYNKGWKTRTQKGRGYVSSTIYNTQYQLTHLLEKGHVTRNGGRTRAFVHISPVEQKCIKQYEKDVERIIKNGG